MVVQVVLVLLICLCLLLAMVLRTQGCLAHLGRHPRLCG